MTTTDLRAHRSTILLLAVALIVTSTAALTGGQRADALDGPVEVVYVATGRNFPDALAGANLAATVGAPLLTVEPDLPVPAATVVALQSLRPGRIVVLGGPAAVSDAVRGVLADYARSGSVTRIEGTDRHDTAAQIAEALPDKVHDADRLDGLDAADFARATATPLAFSHERVTAYVQAASTPETHETVLEYEVEVPVAGTLLVTTTGRFTNQNGRVVHAWAILYVDDENTPDGLIEEAVDDRDAGSSSLPANVATGSSTAPVTVGPGTHTIRVDVHSNDLGDVYGPHDLIATVNSVALFVPA